MRLNREEGEREEGSQKVVYVSKIELRGFKSFGNLKIELPLSSGLTAIVGPNGSGKSNIADALCFVLGEMSAKFMRATRFSDLLFNGGKGQRPAHFAEVSLYFDNSRRELPINSKTVVINRRVDQSGRCDYQINRKRASRQQIIDLLSATMTSPEGYNFVMQGDVDRLIKIDSISRRKMIDDLAGVAEYDEKREKSIAELQRVDTNLVSMGTVLGEISSQLEKLRAEMQEAEKHRELNEKLEEARGKLLHAQVRDCREKLLKLKSNENSLQARIEESKKKKEKIQQQLSAIQEEIKQVDNSILERRSATALMLAERLRGQVGILEEFLTTTRDERATIEGEIAALEEKLQQVASKKSTDEPSVEDVERFISKFEDLRKRFDSLYLKIEKGEFKALREMGEILTELGKVLEILSSKLSSFEHLLKEGPELKRPIEGPRGEKDPGTLSNRLLMLRSQLIQLSSKEEEFETKLKEAKKALTDISSQEEKERGLISRLQRRRTELEPKRASLEQKNSELERKLQELRDELQGVQLEKARLEIQLNSAEKNLRKIKRKIQLSLVERPEEIERYITSLEEQLQQMGPINFRALSDFKTTEERHASEKAKYDKLVGEKESIIRAIEEIDRHKTEVFMHTFEKVSENFSQIFSELSPGGRARLVLENPEHPLEGGLEIEANPAGKIARIGAMSGGEKALTALAFIFALQRMKPTAIYVLDEIDAHLDDDNLRRVAQMLKRLASNSQIIVVTLHEGMMAVADRLFGVSMDKVGVSHLFSVDLKKVGEDLKEVGEIK